MSRSKSRSSSLLKFSSAVALILMLLAAVACGPGSPEEAVTQARAQYSVELNTWFPKVAEEPVAEEGVEGEAAEGEAAEGEAAEEATEGEAAEGEATEGEAAEGEAAEGEGEATEAEAAPTKTTIMFDLIVLFSGSDPLPGITIDISHADSAGTEKSAWRKHLEIPNIVKAETKQISFEAEVDFVEGDQFSVNLLKYVDPANYAEYPEYASATAGGE